ncbi:hypothetical protein RhiirA4_407345 [Rhizophagus irregularis]|uniref:Uncharacterized protein n=1 Tax=Rhizophagus irregularis TaxID=588596 RepID=A0A2I1GXI3_9GLOM|nr:hypothetical protein RhiirA4_407345 [Rhizophagus irregularis]
MTSSLPEFLTNLKHSTIFHVFFTSAVAFIVAFTLDLFFSNLSFYVSYLENLYYLHYWVLPNKEARDRDRGRGRGRRGRGRGRGRRRR